ncbi:hypothetical protein CCYS_09650 [Corynebacterium cystitidis DSM 20524]|uniref:Uncharacterized protein n=1 Tax=Corynebacterium cystitidis DSM 20524 TaxID=1121357 RepID=A0A1H9VPZ3_9CORY|nr:hypothetical protein CCYS_09650 [Corynebacterium cystitidis DSM 20524]SES23860.1 hypothetical protein SAMN05661109_02359 [Corynebacterium cystitidis DSM 20524]SNV69886.1 Uncharacterised protein [Corynebacterium cystitidis]
MQTIFIFVRIEPASGARLGMLKVVDLKDPATNTAIGTAANTSEVFEKVVSTDKDHNHTRLSAQRHRHECLIAGVSYPQFTTTPITPFSSSRVHSVSRDTPSKPMLCSSNARGAFSCGEWRIRH